MSRSPPFCFASRLCCSLIQTQFFVIPEAVRTFNHHRHSVSVENGAPGILGRRWTVLNILGRRVSDYNEHHGKETDIRKTQTADMDLQPVKCYVNFPQPDNTSTSQVQESEGDMGRHVVKDASGEKPYMCEVCGSRTPRKCNLSLHTRTDTDELFDGFDQNDYSAAQNSHLDNHSVTKRAGDKPYMCGECGYRTDYHSHLSNHMRTHTGEKPYKCHQCDYSARQQSALDNHLKRHTGEKPYICRECGYRTITKTNLVRHMRKHTGEKPHACDFCSYSTADKGNLERHITAKHADEKRYVHV